MKHQIYLTILLIIGILIRCAHLMFSHHFLINPDSLYFWIIAQDGPNWYQGGIAPLIYYFGKLGAILIPPLLGVITGLLVYYLASKMFNKNIGLISLAFWTFFQPNVLTFSAGNIDRDCISMLLIAAALVVYYQSKTWRGGIWVAGISALVFLEWRWMGAAIIGAIIGFSALVEYWQTRKVQRPQVLATLGLIAVLVVPFFLSTFYSDLGFILGNDRYAVSEMQPLTIILLWPLWTFLLIPLAFAVIKLWNRPVLVNPTGEEYDTALKERMGLLFLASWIGASLILGLLAYRLSIFMAPAVCILSAVGITYAVKTLAPDKKRAALIFTCGMMFLSVLFSIDLPKGLTTPNTWVKAMEWVKAETPEEARLCTWWDNGYACEAIGERASVTSAAHVRSTDTNHNVALVYCTDNDQYAASLMKFHNAQYVVFSTREENYFKVIENNAEIDGDDGLYRRSNIRLDEGYQSDYFTEVYRNKDVWILEVK